MGIILPRSRFVSSWLTSTTTGIARLKEFCFFFINVSRVHMSSKYTFWFYSGVFAGRPGADKSGKLDMSRRDKSVKYGVLFLISSTKSTRNRHRFVWRVFNTAQTNLIFLAVCELFEPLPHVSSHIILYLSTIVCYQLIESVVNFVINVGVLCSDAHKGG